MVKVAVCRRCYQIESSCRCNAITQVSDRLNSHQRGYTTRWRAFRERLWKKWVSSGIQPVCAMCGESFREESPHFDHIEPVENAEDPRFYDETNIQVLHRECHGIKTREDERLGKTR